MTDVKKEVAEVRDRRPGKNYVEDRAPRETATAIRKLLSEEARDPKSPLYKVVCHVARPAFNSFDVTAMGVALKARNAISVRITEILETFDPDNPKEEFTFSVATALQPESAE
jgi:hypothetical protein